ncbi:phosphopantetheine-binding protein [Bacillus cereus]|jgi:acyl carrier protein|uniref:phosphopantetheine-binding protein n=1 Tax=Bacillus TaxID=1386 RepID=UPI000279A9F9|nr:MULTISPECIES: phosphopantetheine-binding protein [Bacillus]EJR73577.1 acyl carrier protein [Bacillus cereus VD166]KIQ78186.1 hypothetical protein RW25_28335 [Bacillus sp. L_1B0_8]KIQ82550.1 hypothetical protein RT27_23895 [Bacillus sp. L_1B0_5]MDA1913586.1 phosphopantetheine-binding protein [Bacillus cereus]MDA2659706.1 phosphopantetheine-binding protein [Bacillus cereus]
MNTIKNLKDLVTGIVAKQLELQKHEIKEDANIFEDLGLDSTGVIELLLALEEECEIEFDMEELDPANLESINAITEYILELR